jgi:uncharacterized protein YcbX
MSPVTVQHLFIYPVKSLCGVEVDSIEFTEFGPKDDRCYMLIDANQRFVTQRSHPVLSQFRLVAQENGWLVKFGDHQSPVITHQKCSDFIFQTKVWNSAIQVREKCRHISDWFSEQLDELVRLVEFDDLETRFSQIADHQSPLSFADAYPLLICNSESLRLLSQRLNVHLAMQRFRPNVVISMEENTEFLVSSFRMESGELLVGPPCVRCNIPAIDPETAVYQRDLHKQLKAELLRDGQVVFGVNASPLHLKTLTVGDSLSPVMRPSPDISPKSFSG